MNHAIAHAPPFQAHWDATNLHLKDSVMTTARVVWTVFAAILPFLSYFYFPKLFPVLGLAYLLNWGLNVLAKETILSPFRISIDRLAKLESDLQRSFQPWDAPFSLQRQEITTPDGVILMAYLVKRKNNPPPTRTLVHFNPNAVDGLPFLRSQLEQISRIPACNFVFFDYRGTGNSQGKLKQSKDLIVDGLSVVQWVHAHLRTRKNQIHFYGRSIGGAVAAETQALDPELRGQHINERSFSSLANVIESHVGPLGIALGWFLRSQGYELDAATAFTKIRGEKLVIYHARDQIIPLEASLYRSLPRSNNVPPLEDSPYRDRRGRAETLHLTQHSKNPHNEPLPYEVTQQIANFMPPPYAPSTDPPRYQGPSLWNQIIQNFFNP